MPGPRRIWVGPKSSSKMDTARWAKQQLLKMNWYDRHDVSFHIKENKKDIYRILMTMLSPDQHLDGVATGVQLSSNTIIVAKDKPRYKQPTLHKYFK